MTTQYTLDSYGNFEQEQQLLDLEFKKKKEQETRLLAEQIEYESRFKCIIGYFLRCSWPHKKQFVLSIIKRVKCFDNLLRIISHMSTMFGKMAAYIDVSPNCRNTSEQILMDHDRGMDCQCLKEAIYEDLEWLATVPEEKLMAMIMELLREAGEGLLRKLYIPIVNIYNKKLLEDAQLKERNLPSQQDMESIFDEAEPDDSDKYPRDHPLTIEVEKLRKKWDEIIDKYRREVFATDKKGKANDKKKSEKTTKHKKSGTDEMDWVQMLPVWIVKKILNYFDAKALQNLKKVNSYWSYACDSLIKDRQARELLNKAIETMAAKADPKILKECRESGGLWDETVRRPNSPREKRLKKLMNRGAVLKTMRPTVKKSEQTRTCLATSVPRNKDIYNPFEKLSVFPRLIREDLLLYKTYPCILKDVNILFDVDDNVRKQRDTLSYTLSQQLSDTFSLSEANLADW